MSEERRNFLKLAASAGVAGLATLLKAKCTIAADMDGGGTHSNGVVIGHSPKKEILYKKTANWDRFYKSSY